jgi:Zn-dependent metalloprotease
MMLVCSVAAPAQQSTHGTSSTPPIPSKALKITPLPTSPAFQRAFERLENWPLSFVDVDDAVSNEQTLNTAADRMGTASVVRVNTKQLQHDYHNERLQAASQTASQITSQAAQKAVKLAVGMSLERFDTDLNGTTRFITGKLGVLQSRVTVPVALAAMKNVPSHSQSTLPAKNAEASKQPIVVEALSFLASSALLPRLDNPSAELALMSLQRDELEFQHIRFEQRSGGLRVYGRDVYVHTNASGEVYCINGQYEPTSATATLATTPRVTPVQAVSIIQSAVQSAVGGDIAPLSQEPELIIYPMNGRSYLAYIVETHVGNQAWKYFVDARTGLVLHRVGASPIDGAAYWGANAQKSTVNETSAVPNQGQPHSAKQSGFTWESVAISEAPLYPSSASATATSVETTPQQALQAPKKKTTAEILDAGGFVNVQGVDLLGIMRTVRAWRRASDNAIFPVSDAVGYRTTPDEQLPRRPNGGHVVLNANGAEVNALENLTINFITPDQTFSPAIISALWLTDSAAKYWATRFNRTSWDGNGTRMTTMLNVGGSDRDAAFWSSSLGAQGYGPGVRTALSTVGDLWTIGHEFGHAVNGASARLEYNNGQQGSMEEHFANVWGWMLDRDSFWMARQAFGTDPNNGGRHFGARDSMRASVPTRMSAFRTDVTTPHANAGIPDRAAYVCILSLGRDTTERLWYRALTNYITQNSGFADLRRGVTQAANDVYPTNSRVLAVINQAFDDAEILLTTPPTQRFVAKGGPVAPAETQALRSVIALTTRSGRIGYVDVATKAAVFFTGNFTISRPGGQLSVPASGKRIYFVNRGGQLAFVEPLTLQTGLFSNLFIRQQGDIGSAAISPDEKTVAMTSTYDNDPNIYIATIGTISAVSTTTNPAPRIIPINRDVSTGAANGTGRSEGRDISGVRYADALTWSPDTRYPAIGVDALSQVRIDRDTISYWSLYYADLTGARPEVYDLFPPQADVTLSYPAFASRSGSSMAFAEILPNNTNDIYVADFDLGTDRGYLNLQKFAFLVGTARISVLTADQPTFSPDDKQICFVAPNISSQAVFLYSFASGTSAAKVEGIVLDSTVTRPVWTNIDIQFTSVGNASNDDSFALRIAPNPISNQATTQFTLPQAQYITLALHDALGQRVATLRSGVEQAGAHTVAFDTQTLPSGVYVLRLQAGSMVNTQKISVVR